MTDLTASRETISAFDSACSKLFKRRITCMLVIAGFFAGVALFAPQPQYDRFQTPSFEGKLTLMRALSGPFHTLLADRYWLLSGSLNEIHYSKRDKQKNDPFFKAMQTIVTFDPGYESPIRYGSTYLASILGKTDQAQQLLDTALAYLPDNAELYLLKISLEVSYNSLPHYDNINQWLTEIKRIEGEIPEWLGGLLLHAKKRELQRELQREDLIWLLENATNEIEKATIEQKIAELED